MLRKITNKYQCNNRRGYNCRDYKKKSDVCFHCAPRCFYSNIGHMFFKLEY